MAKAKTEQQIMRADRLRVMDDRNALLNRIRSIELGMNGLTAEVMDNILKRLNVKGYRYTKDLEKRIEREFKRIEPGLTAVAVAGSLLIRKSLKHTMGKRDVIAGVKSTEGTLKKILDRAKIENLSPALHSTNRLIRDRFIKQLKKSLNAGEAMEAIAKKLLDIENPAVNVPKFIREIEQAARRTITDPKQFNILKKTIKKHQRYIDSLTRAGEPGFERLGLRRASKVFIKDIQKATTETIDAVVNNYVDKKALYHQKVVARNEATKAYNQYNNAYMRETDYVIGEDWHLSVSHPVADECDELAGPHLYVDGTPPEPIDDTHINCLCYKTAIIDPAILSDQVSEAA